MTVSTMMSLVVMAAEFSPFSRAKKGFSPQSQPENWRVTNDDVTRLWPDRQELKCFSSTSYDPLFNDEVVPAELKLQNRGGR